MLTIIPFNGIQEYQTLLIIIKHQFILHINNNFTMGPMCMRFKTLAIVKWTLKTNPLLKGLQKLPEV